MPCPPPACFAKVPDAEGTVGIEPWEGGPGPSSFYLYIGSVQSTVL